jgi:hypothetical protein
LAAGVDLSKLGPEEVQRELARPHSYVAGLMPGYDIYSLNISSGAAPEDAALLSQGQSGADPYTYGAVVGLSARLAPSQGAPGFNPLDIPRISVSDPTLDQALRDANKVGIGYVSAGE